MALSSKKSGLLRRNTTVDTKARFKGASLTSIRCFTRRARVLVKSGIATTLYATPAVELLCDERGLGLPPPLTNHQSVPECLSSERRIDASLHRCRRIPSFSPRSALEPIDRPSQRQQHLRAQRRA